MSTDQQIQKFVHHQVCLSEANGAHHHVNLNPDYPASIDMDKHITTLVCCLFLVLLFYFLLCFLNSQFYFSSITHLHQLEVPSKKKLEQLLNSNTA